MRQLSDKRIATVTILIVMVILASFVVAIMFIQRGSESPRDTISSKKVSDQPTIAKKTVPKEAYKGKAELVADTFTVEVPNGWQASIADTGSFRGIMFARPETLSTLQYSAESTPVIDRNGIPSWNGLTEHFFIITPSAGKEFTPSDHREIASSTFTFDNGAQGTKYEVVKHAEEAAQYGGLLRDDEWQGCTYIYQTDGARVEAHLALYPSSTIDKAFYESVVRTIKLK